MSVIHGYRPTSVRCRCGDTHGAVETTDEKSVYLYRCWCGATAKFTLDPDEEMP